MANVIVADKVVEVVAKSDTLKVIDKTIANTTEKIVVDSKNKMYDMVGTASHIRGSTTHVANAANSEILVITKNEGTFKISARDYMCFSSDDPAISVYTTDDNSMVCENFKLQADQSVIITKERTLVLTQYGKVWIDFKGINHTPSSE
ncbi:hypothetical protein SNE40_003452 [Patella caerulea]|uniref:Uncharacterized protein n=1 Tax=Patella caerulea TaxID=87958 RepID=A0AAN8K7Z1_PATCE